MAVRELFTPRRAGPRLVMVEMERRRLAQVRSIMVKPHHNVR